MRLRPCFYISPHQLSEFINEHMGVNFSSYMNHYRVEEAKDLLVNNPEQSALSIGLQVALARSHPLTIFLNKRPA